MAKDNLNKIICDPLTGSCGGGEGRLFERAFDALQAVAMACWQWGHGVGDGHAILESELVLLIDEKAVPPPFTHQATSYESRATRRARARDGRVHATVKEDTQQCMVVHNRRGRMATSHQTKILPS
jgi:hypothetical protein